MGLDYLRDQADEEEAAEADRRARGEEEQPSSLHLMRMHLMNAGAEVSAAMQALWNFAGKSNERMMDVEPWSIVNKYLNEAESMIDVAEMAFEHHVMGHHFTDQMGKQMGANVLKEDCTYDHP